MRDSLRKSAADSPASGFDQYPKGSIVVCNACAKPIFKLDVSIQLGAGAGRMAAHLNRRPTCRAEIHPLN